MIVLDTNVVSDVCREPLHFHTIVLSETANVASKRLV